MTKNVKIGKRDYQFEFEGNKLYDVVAASQYIGFNSIPSCGLVKSDNLILSAHEAQGYKYTTVKCMNCRATLTLGERKDGTAMYIRTNEQKKPDWQAFQPKQSAQPRGGYTQSSQNGLDPAFQAQPVYDDEVPF